jgi:hypothetical protein
MTSQRVLVVGLDPAQFEEWDPAPVQAAIARGKARFEEAGLVADYCLVTVEERPVEVVAAALQRHDYGCVVIGAGLRGHDPLLELFEAIVNLARQHAPIAFDSTPDDCVDAALRQLR